MTRSKRAAFLDRDGVLVKDVGPLLRRGDVRFLPGVAEALGRLRRAGLERVVISNQTAVARGLSSEDAVIELEKWIESQLCLEGDGGRAPGIDAFYYCPHHPEATVSRYRRDCDCRKPRPGLIRRACEERGLDPRHSVMIGDRLSDVYAGAAIGCRTVWVQTGRHTDPPIVSNAWGAPVQPDHVCAGLAQAVDWILATGVMEAA